MLPNRKCPPLFSSSRGFWPATSVAISRAPRTSIMLPRHARPAPTPRPRTDLCPPRCLRVSASRACRHPPQAIDFASDVCGDVCDLLWTQSTSPSPQLRCLCSMPWPSLHRPVCASMVNAFTGCRCPFPTWRRRSVCSRLTPVKVESLSGFQTENRNRAHFLVCFAVFRSFQSKQVCTTYI